MQASTQATYGVGTAYTWDAFIRQSYDQANRAINDQARILTNRGNVSWVEARALVEGQRNALVMQMRNRLSPWGRIYSELLKPSANLPTLDQLVARKGSVEAVLVSVGKSRSSVNRLTATLRVAGPAAIVIQLTLSAVIIAEARPEERGRVAAGQGGAIAGGALGGAGGAWAGCATLAAIASPSLVLPIVGEVTTGGACLVGGIAGAAGAGWVGAMLGERASASAYDFVTRLRWIDG